MSTNKNIQKKKVAEFVDYWKDKGYEKGECQPFWLSFLRDILGIENPEQHIIFEDQVKIDHTAFIDAIIPETHVLIEQKSRDKDLRKAIKQSDGQLLTPFQQAKRYSAELPYSKRPRWVITCNFREFYIYDMERPSGDPEVIRLEDLPSEAYRLQFIVEQTDERITREINISVKAGAVIGRFYDALLKCCKDPNAPKTLEDLNILCVRTVFCCFAEDAGLYGDNQFHDYLAQYQVKDLRRALKDLFDVLDTPESDRDPYIADELMAFPYTNGHLFAGQIDIPAFSEEAANILIREMCEEFDWEPISPAVFGNIFESTLNPETRHSNGAHFTNPATIGKLIGPLFLDDLKTELEEACNERYERTRTTKLNAFRKKLSEIVVFDPACGSGNILCQAYCELRRLENKALMVLSGGQMSFADENTSPIMVKTDNFVGIELNSFGCAVARTSMYIAELQMAQETEQIVHMPLANLPLKSYNGIHEGNALRMDWSVLLDEKKQLRICGNPPYLGARLMSKEQKEDMLFVFGSKWRNLGNLDYVSCWFKKASDLMDNWHNVKATFVSTNSITQGEQVAILWRPLFESGLHFDFAYKSFKWESEAESTAAVTCVIIGFSKGSKETIKRLYTGDREKQVKNINSYLNEGPNVFIDSRNKPICNVPEIGIGNKPVDGGNYLFAEEEMFEFIKREPSSQQYFKPWYGAEELLKNKPRFCLWLGDCTPAEIRKMSHCMRIVEAVRDFRLASKSPGTQKIADKPTRFHVENMPKSNFIVIPGHTSDERKYIPISILPGNALASNATLIFSTADTYIFGVVTSNVHMAWVRAVCGRLGEGLRYSGKIVYNNFPWPQPTPQQKARIEQTAQQILDVRAKYPDCSLADLYDDLVMPADLREAHRANDRAVMAAYGFSTKMTESECVAELMKLYQALVEKEAT